MTARRSHQRQLRRNLSLVTVIGLLAGLVLTASPAAARSPFVLADQQDRPARENQLLRDGKPLPDFDVRRQAGTPISNARMAIARGLQDRVGPGTNVQFDTASGGIRQILRVGGYLSSASDASPSGRILSFLAENRGLLRLSGDELATFDVEQARRDSTSGVTHVYFGQTIRGLRVFGTSLKGHVDAQGRLISIEASYYPGTSHATRGSLTAEAAVRAALESSMPDLLAKAKIRGSSVTSAGTLSRIGTEYLFPRALEAASGADKLTVFEPGPLSQPIRARQVIFPTLAGSVLAWQVEATALARKAAYVMVVDATDGRLLYRTNLIYNDSNSDASVFTKNPDDTPLSVEPYFGNLGLSPDGWSSGKATIGNNVQADSATSTGDFIYPFTDDWKDVGPNSLDVAGLQLRFTPTDTDATGYSVTTVATGSPAPAATNLLPFFTNTDDGTVNLICGGGWTANVLGESFTSFWVNTNGSVSLGAGITDFFPSKVSFSNDARRVAGLWRDLNPGGGGTLTGDCAPEGGGTRIRIVWDSVPNFPSGGSHTFAIVIHGIGTGLDNIIDIDYGAISSPIGELIGVGGNAYCTSVDVPCTTVGVPFDPATTGIVSYRDLSGATTNPGIAGGVAQTFPDQDLNLSITNAGYHLNWMHDYFYGLGFNEAAGNFQLDNFGNGGSPGDPVQAEVQFGLGVRNNAFFQVTPDGTPGFSGFGLFSDGGTCRRDSAFDASVIRHEYTHGMTTRMVGGPSNVSSLTSFQGGALGEGWSDAFATATLNDPVVGAYTTCSAGGARSAPYDAHPGTYADFGNQNGPFAAGIGSVFVPEVHLDGEIWAATAWDIHEALGEPTSGQLLFEALNYTPVEPSMVDAKNAVLVADQVLHGGSHLDELFDIFAARGLGVSASASEGSFSDESLSNGWRTTVFAAYDTPDHPYGNTQSDIFYDDFDGGAAGWTVAGVDGAGGGPLWHLSSRKTASEDMAFYYGQETSGDYDTGFRNYGSLMSPAINLPAVGSYQALVLEWDHNRRTEDPFFFDAGVVRIIDLTAGSARTQVSFVQNTLTSFGATNFEHQMVNLSAFAGHQVQVEFFMDTFDGIANSAEGWYVDNVRVSTLGTADATAPVVTPPVTELAEDEQLSRRKLPIRVSWSASDPSGITAYELQQRVNGGAWTSITLPSPTTTDIVLLRKPGKTYQFRVRATDGASNTSLFVAGAARLLDKRQETNAAINYIGTWTQASPSYAYGGGLKYATSSSARATFSVNASSLAWVAARNSTRGMADVYIDGVFAETIDLYSPALQARVVVFARSWPTAGSHTIQIRVDGTVGRPRVDLDALLFLR